MEARIIDEKLAADFRKYGFAVIDRFWDDAAIGNILRATEAFREELDAATPFSTSTDSIRTEFRQAMRDAINAEVLPEKTVAYFEGYTPFYSNLLIKKPHAHSEMVLHTDWSITDESRYLPLQIWIPLTDVSRENGTLAVVPGSHHLTHVYRGLGVEEPYLAWGEELMRDQLFYLEVPRGTAVLYHPGILHYSPPNRSAQNRLAVLVSYYPTAYGPVLYHKARISFPGSVSVYELTPGFFDTWDKKSSPRSLNRIGSVRQPRSVPGKREFLSTLALYRYEKGL